MFEVEVQDEFSAAHFLKLYDGSWEPRHGHNWKVSVVMRAGRLDSMGVAVDFEQLKPRLRSVLNELNEISLNDHPAFKSGRLNPSTENIAKIIYEKLAQGFQSPNAEIVKVTVWETPDASASYYSDGRSPKGKG